MSLDSAVDIETAEQKGIAFSQRQLEERGNQITPTTLADIHTKTQAVAGFRRPPETLPTSTEVAFKQTLDQARQQQTNAVNSMVEKLRVETQEPSPGDRLRALQGKNRPL